MSARCHMLTESRYETADMECPYEASHLVPGTPLGPVAMCDKHYAEWLADNDAPAGEVPQP